VFASVNLCIGITFSCIVPFFPAQARAKGLSTAEVGFIIGFYQLGQAIMAPLFGQSVSVTKIVLFFIRHDSDYVKYKVTLISK
jgi:MFS family permease